MNFGDIIGMQSKVYTPSLGCALRRAVEIIVMNFKEDITPPYSYLIEMWSFISGKKSKNEFQQWVNEQSPKFFDLLDWPSFDRLMFFDFREAGEQEIDDVKEELKRMVEEYPLRCECIKLADYQILRVDSYQAIRYSNVAYDQIFNGHVIDYAENQVLPKFSTLKSRIEIFSNFRKEFGGAYDFWTDGTLYRCSECNDCWLSVYNECYVEYLFYRLSEDEAVRAAVNGKWPQDIQLWFE